MISITPELILSTLAFCIQIIAGASFFNVFRSGGKLHGGHSPGSGKWVNMEFYNSYSVFCFGLISLFFAIAELGLVIKPELFAFVDSMILRAVIYFLKGIATLGTSGDLGIAAGSMEIIIGVTMVVFVIFRSALNCQKNDPQ